MIAVAVVMLMAVCALAGIVNLAEFLMSGHWKWGALGFALLWLAALAPWIARAPW